MEFSRKRVFIIADIGGAPEGDMKRAKRMVNLAAKAGVDAIKFQSYRADTLIHKKHMKKMHDHFKKLEFTPNQFRELHDYVVKKGKIFMSTPFDTGYVDFLSPLVPIFKVGSAELSDFLLIKKILKKNKPVMLSTGVHTSRDIEKTLRFIKKQRPGLLKQKKVMLLHCVADYPTPDDSANLRSIEYLQDKFGLPVGYSDHTIGSHACIAAVALGAVVIEKHFTDNKEKGYFVHQMSADYEDMKQLVSGIRSLEKQLGKYGKFIQPSEIKNKRPSSFRRSLYAKREIKKGKVIKESDLITLRPAVKNGVSPSDFDMVIGKRAKKDIKELGLIRLKDLR